MGVKFDFVDGIWLNYRTAMAKLAVYAGSFDPVTEGHLDIIARAAGLFDRLIVTVSNNFQKKATFSVEDRIRMLEESHSFPNVEVGSFSGLLVDYMRSVGAKVVLRGLRVVSDMDYEFQMAYMNQHLYTEVETVFMMPTEKYTYLSSSMVKEIAGLGGDLKGLVPSNVGKALKAKFKKK